MNFRPILKIMRREKQLVPKQQRKWSIIDWFYEVGGWLLLGILWIYIWSQYRHLPQTIPTHFALDGGPDGFSSKEYIFLLPGIVSFLYIVMTFINMFPQVYNYMVTITPLNAKKNYTSATRMVRFLKFILVIMFCFICFQSIQVALGKSGGLGKLFLPVTFITFFIITIATLMGALRHTHRNED